MDLKTLLIISAPQVLSLLLLVAVIWYCYAKNKNEFKNDLKKAEQQEINTAINQPNITKQEFFIICFKPLSYYLIYFIIIVPALVLFLGKIEYGPNWTYVVFLAVVGIPFLISFFHFTMIAEKNRYRLYVSGNNKSQISSTVSGLILCIPVAIFFMIWVVWVTSNKVFG